MNFGIVIPAHNEADFLAQTLDSLLAQSHPAKQIVVVNDHSTDQTATIADAFASKHSSVRTLHLESESKHLPGSKVVKAFLAGIEQIDPLPDVICKFDADLIFPPDYLQTLAGHFESNPNLGMMGGFCYIEKDGKWVLESLTAKDHIRGALKAYRKKCYVEIGGLNPSMGWDTLDELLARYKGWEVTTDPNLVVKHLRPTGINYHGQSRYKQGEAFKKLGYDYWLAAIAAAKGALKRKSLSFYLDTMKGFRKYDGPKLVNEQEEKFIRQYRWRGIKNKLLGKK